MNCLKLMLNKCLRQCALPALLGLALGCDGTLTFTPLPDGADGGENAGQSPTPVAVDDSLLAVRLVNVSDLALDVRFYVSSDPEVATADQLFVEANAFREGIGFLSLGILEAGQVVDVPVPCKEALFVGTVGGEFLDPVTGESIAEGTTARLAQLGPQFDCGNRVTFMFFANLDGQPTATLSIE